MKVVNLMEQIRMRPAMYLGERSLSALYHHILGYMAALGMHQIKSDDQFQIPEDFSDWVAYRLHYKESTSGWKNMIVSSSPNEAAAFERFFELLDEHANRHATIFARLTECQKTYTLGVGERVRTKNFPASISLLAFTDDPGFFAVSNVPDNPLPIRPFFPSFKRLVFLTKHSKLTILDTDVFARLSKDEP